jgi:hypothetical protein
MRSHKVISTYETIQVERTEVAISSSDPALTRTEYEGAAKVVQRMLSLTKFVLAGVMIDEVGMFLCRQSSKVSIFDWLDDAWAAAAPTDLQTAIRAKNDIGAMRGSIFICVGNQSTGRSSMRY